MAGRVNRSRPVLVVGMIAVASLLPGCASLVAIATHDLVTTAGVASYIATGKGLSDHVLDAATGKDCKLVTGLASPQRNICERAGSGITQNEFRGMLNYEPGTRQWPDLLEKTDTAATISPLAMHSPSRQCATSNDYPLAQSFTHSRVHDGRLTLSELGGNPDPDLVM